VRAIWGEIPIPHLLGESLGLSGGAPSRPSNSQRGRIESKAALFANYWIGGIASDCAVREKSARMIPF
jgi:hypothetical protein